MRTANTTGITQFGRQEGAVLSHTFVAFLVFTIVAFAAFIYVAKTKNRTTSNTSSSTNYGKYVAGIATGFALLSLVIAIFTIVPTKRVGVVTSFGKPTGTLSNGLHAIWPWEKVTSFDAAIQTDRHDDERNDGDTGNNPDKCTLVRIANGGSTACLDNIIRWRIRKDEADTLYRDYRDFDRVRESLVTRELVFGGSAVMRQRYVDAQDLDLVADFAL